MRLNRLSQGVPMTQGLGAQTQIGLIDIHIVQLLQTHKVGTRHVS